MVLLFVKPIFCLSKSIKNIELSVTTSQFSLTRILTKNDFLKDKKINKNADKLKHEVIKQILSLISKS
jgi:hypothetical protein